MTTASLTPNMDAGLRAIEEMRLLVSDGMADRGRKGVATRMGFTLAAAAVTAVAEENDRSSPSQDIFQGFVSSLCSVIMQTSLTFVGEDDAPRAMLAISKLIQQHMEAVAAGRQFNGHQVAVHADKVGAA